MEIIKVDLPDTEIGSYEFKEWGIYEFIPTGEMSCNCIVIIPTFDTDFSEAPNVSNQCIWYFYESQILAMERLFNTVNENCKIDVGSDVLPEIQNKKNEVDLSEIAKIIAVTLKPELIKEL